MNKMINTIKKYRIFFLLLLIMTNAFLPDYALSLMNKSSDILFYLGTILILTYYSLIGYAGYFVVIDIRDFYREMKEEKEKENNQEQ
jgi:predicted membrane protein